MVEVVFIFVGYSEPVPLVDNRKSIRLFGWDQVREEENFARFFNLDEARIITADGRSVGWIQEQVDDTRINLGSFYVMQGNAAARHWNTGSSDTAGARR